MEDNPKARLSALMDGELPPAMAKRAIDRLLGERELRDQWERYHLIRDAMQSNLQARVSTTLGPRVRAAIDAQPTPLPAGRTRARGLAFATRPLAAAAIAASVAAIAILGVRELQTDPTKPSDSSAAVTQRAFEAPPVVASSATHLTLPTRSIFPVAQRRYDVSPPAALRAPVDWNQLTPGTIARLNAYLLRHIERSSGTVPSHVPYVRMVARD